MSENRRRKMRVQGGWASQSEVHRGPRHSEGSRGARTNDSSTASFEYKSHEAWKVDSIKPPNFSWIVEGLLAGSSFPSKAGHFEFFKDQGVNTVVTLTEFKIPAGVIISGMNVIFMPVVEFEPPKLKQVINFVEIVDTAKAKNEGVVCHCHWGRGRTGTMLASYLVKHRLMHPRDAIDYVRLKRPYSVETYEQENIVFEYTNYLRRQSENCKTQDISDCENDKKEAKWNGYDPYESSQELSMKF